MTLSTSLTRLFRTECPIMSAPMDAVAGGELAAAVSRAGGLGLIGGGYGNRKWLARQFDLAAGTRVGCGFITWSLARHPALLDLALTYRPVAVMLSFGDPTGFAETIKSAGSLLVCQVQDRAQADQALQAGTDVLVAQGSEAGGHGYGPRSTLTLVPELVDLVADHEAGVPVVAAGGIADGRGIAAALALGASGTLLGSRFYACTEALSTPSARATVLAATGDDCCRTTVYDQVRGYLWPAGHTMNVLHNAFTDRWQDSPATLSEHLDDARLEYQQAVTDRDYDIANVTIGQATGLIDTVRPAAEIVADLVEQAGAALHRS